MIYEHIMELVNDSLPLSKWNMWHKDSFHSSHLYSVYLELAENRKSHSEFVF